MINNNTLGNLIGRLSRCKKYNWQDLAVSHITDDSRQVGPGTLFVAVNGEEHDGHDFISEALSRGASALMCRRLPEKIPACPVLQVNDPRKALSAVSSVFYGTPQNGIKPIGVTGTDGKTTTTWLIRAVLGAAGCKTGLLGSLEYDLGLRTIASSQTTPHPVTLHSMLKEMNLGGMTHAVMEVSSHSLVHRRTAHVPFDVAVLTNVTEDHLDFHGTLEEYTGAKQMLFEQLSPDSVAILNADCPVWERYAAASRASVLTYGIREMADIKLITRSPGIDGTGMVINTPRETYQLHAPLVGDFNCENVLAAAAVAFAYGVPGETVKGAITDFSGVPGRLEKINSGVEAALPSVFVDYAHTPDALGKILRTLRPLTKGQLICVFGCGGDRERRKRPKMGYASTSEADVSIITSDNSRSERTGDIISDIIGGIDRSGGRYITDPDRRRAISKAFGAAVSKDDVIVVCGKGAEGYQHIGNAKIPFDDREVCREIMNKMLADRRKSA